MVPFTAALMRLLLRKSGEGLWWAQISNLNGCFANLGPGNDGWLWTQVGGNATLPTECELSAEQEVELLRLGWRMPTGAVDEGLANYVTSSSEQWSTAAQPTASDRGYRTRRPGRVQRSGGRPGHLPRAARGVHDGWGQSADRRLAAARHRCAGRGSVPGTCLPGRRPWVGSAVGLAVAAGVAYASAGS